MGQIVATTRIEKQERRARDSNPQPVSRHLNSNQLPTALNPADYANSGQGAARGAAVGAAIEPLATVATGSGVGQDAAPGATQDAELGEVIDRWATLPDPVRLAVLALVRSAK